MPTITRFLVLRIIVILLLTISTSILIIISKKEQTQDTANNVLSAHSEFARVGDETKGQLEDQISPTPSSIVKIYPTKDVSELEKDKIILELEGLKFDNLSPQDILKNLEKIFTQEVTEELKSIEI